MYCQGKLHLPACGPEVTRAGGLYAPVRPIKQWLSGNLVTAPTPYHQKASWQEFHKHKTRIEHREMVTTVFGTQQ